MHCGVFRRSVFGFLAISVVLTFHAPAQAVYRDIDDPCSTPTPYPPADAAWGSVHNGGFEQGFTGSVANRWVGWKDPAWTSQVFYIGSDRAYAGSYSQKLVLPRPSGDFKEAGIYQQIYVVPGETYTISAKVYLSMPNTSNGEFLLAYFGVTPYGDDSGDAGSMIWREVSRQNEWVDVSLTMEAIFPVMTIGLKGTRKWPLGGDNASVWFDAVTVSGPVPTDPPPGPGEEPVDPESLIPVPFGPNHVTNPSFEENTTGVSAGWTQWSTVGSGTWKRSQRVGKIGGARYDCGGEQENIDMRPKTVLLLGPDPIKKPQDNATLGTVDLFNQYPHMQDTIIVGRPFIDGDLGTYFDNPEVYGPALAEGCRILQDRFPRIDCWQGLNEPSSMARWQNTLAFEYHFTQRAHELGLKTCVLNLATGNPGNIWNMIDERYDPSCHDLLETADYLGHHVYGWAPDEFMVSHQVSVDACQFALRPRAFEDMYARRGWRYPPVIGTEGSTSAPWQDKYTPDQVVDDLVLMGDYMNADKWWCGYTNFVVGALCSWPAFDIVGQYVSDGRNMAEAIGDWNYDHPADATDGYHSQMFGAGHVHPQTAAQAVPAGRFTGGVAQQVTGLTPGQTYLVACWMKYAFRGHQPDQLQFHIGIDETGQTANGAAATIDWGDDQIAGKAPVHETFSHVWRTFRATGTTASIWLRAHQPVSDPSVMFYVDDVEVRPAMEVVSADPGDVDGDGDVDQADFGYFQACLTGTGQTSGDPLCLKVDFDDDKDIDAADFSVFAGCMTGADVPSDPTCAD